MKPYEFVKAITQTKENLFEDPQAEKDYKAFVVNRGLSYHVDTILQANEMNMYSEIPVEMQFKFLMETISRKKRWVEWDKKEENSRELNIIVEYYKCSLNRAKEYALLLNDDQINELEQLLDRGGKR